MNLITTIDLWTEQHDNHFECFNGAFVDGFEGDHVPFDEYKIVKNCNCVITTKSKDIRIANKHNVLVFYEDRTPTRLVALNRATDIEKCIDIALNQYFGDGVLRDLYTKLGIKSSTVDLQEPPIFNGNEETTEIDVGSCDRWGLLYNMLQGLYTEANNSYGNFSDDKYYFIPNLHLEYNLKTDAEEFKIVHKCAFMNTAKTRLIPIQEGSPLTQTEGR